MSIIKKNKTTTLNFQSYIVIVKKKNENVVTFSKTYVWNIMEYGQ